MGNKEDRSVSVLDYGCGNINSVIRMLEKAGGKAVKISTQEDIRKAGKLIIPGVGAFDHGMTQLSQRGMVDALNEFALIKKRPIMGVCLGMQLMGLRSEEGVLPGLGWVDAEALHFRHVNQSDLKIPHMSWAELNIVKSSDLFENQSEISRFYFVHSYFVRARDKSIVTATASYGSEFVAAFQKQNVMGVQFHPEKSHRFGLALMSRFLEISL